MIWCANTVQNNQQFKVLNVKVTHTWHKVLQIIKTQRNMPMSRMYRYFIPP